MCLDEVNYSPYLDCIKNHNLMFRLMQDLTIPLPVFFKLFTYDPPRDWRIVPIQP